MEVVGKKLAASTGSCSDQSRASAQRGAHDASTPLRTPLRQPRTVTTSGTVEIELALDEPRERTCVCYIHHVLSLCPNEGTTLYLQRARLCDLLTAYKMVSHALGLGRHLPAEQETHLPCMSRQNTRCSTSECMGSSKVSIRVALYYIATLTVKTAAALRDAETQRHVPEFSYIRWLAVTATLSFLPPPSCSLASDRHSMLGLFIVGTLPIFHESHLLLVYDLHDLDVIE